MMKRSQRRTQDKPQRKHSGHERRNLPRQNQVWTGGSADATNRGSTRTRHEEQSKRNRVGDGQCRELGLDWRCHV